MSGSASARDGGKRDIVRVHDPLQGQMFHLTGPLSGGQSCQLSPFRPHMQPFVGGGLKAGLDMMKNQQNSCLPMILLSKLLSKTNSPMKLQFTQHTFCLLSQRRACLSIRSRQIEKNYRPSLFQVKILHLPSALYNA